MPCDTIQTNSVELKAANRGLLKTALERAGYTVVEAGNGLRFHNSNYSIEGTWEGGRVNARTRYGAQFDANQVKRNYSAEVVRNASQRFGWRLKQTGERCFEVQKRH